MNLLLVSLILLLAFAAITISSEIGIPSLMVFLIIGVIFSYTGFQVENFDTAIDLATLALIVITFYAGFVVNGDTLESSIRESLLLSTVGVLITVGAIGVFSHFVLGFGLNESLLLGAVVGSTDAAGIFSMLRGKSLNLKYDTIPMISFESGANDTLSKSLTFAFVATMGMGVGAFTSELIKLVLVGLLVGYIFSYIFSKLIKFLRIKDHATTAIFLLSALMVTYSVVDVLGGNGFISAYMLGLFLGNNEFEGKRDLVSFFESLSGIMEVGFFFLVGVFLELNAFIIAFPISVVILLFITFIARPLAVMPILSFFKRPTNQKLFVSFAGFRGSTAIILALKSMHLDLSFDLLQIVFGIVIASFIVQNFGLPLLARRLDMLDSDASVMRTFNDYIYETSLGFLETKLGDDNFWVNKQIKDLNLGKDLLIGKVIRDEKELIPHGNTEILPGDTLVLSGRTYESNKHTLIEKILEENSSWIGVPLMEIPMEEDMLIIGILRDDQILVPSGRTMFEPGDRVVISKKI